VRVLLDECLPRRLKRDLVGHEAHTAPEMGWASKRNGELLRLAQHEFDVFLTVDRKLQHQQNLASFNIAVIVMVAGTNRHGCRDQQSPRSATADFKSDRAPDDREAWRGDCCEFLNVADALIDPRDGLITQSYGEPKR
jgi:hypothetical protein